jgi:hypothetical protein
MILEHVCGNEQCPEYGVVVEHYYGHDPGELQCEQCREVAGRVVSNFGVVFTGPISRKYQDPKREGYGEESWYEWRVKSSKSGKPEPVLIDSWAALKQFRADEKLVGRDEMGPVEGTSDGKYHQSAGRGLPGCWG